MLHRALTSLAGRQPLLRRVLRSPVRVMAKSQSTEAKQDAITTTDKQQDKKSSEEMDDIKEEEFVIDPFVPKDLVPEVPITSLDVLRRISKLEKKGSFSVDIFTGRYDAEFLTYPDPLYDRKENQKLKDQATMVRQLWPQIWDDNAQLQKFNFFHMYQLSATEMMTIFEAIGASSRNCLDLSLPANQDIHTNALLQTHQTLVTKAIISLITRNCLTYWPMFHSKNLNIKDLLPKKNIAFGPIESNEPLLPIGFCWTEQPNELGSLPPQEWLTTGQHGGQTLDHYLIQGKKNKILFEESTENYLVYYRDKFLSENYETKFPDDEPNPASDPFVGCILMNKSELRASQIYHDSAGFRYVDIDVDTTVPGDRVVFPAQRKDPHALNVKSLGQIATCSVVLGILKEAQQRVYKYLIDNKRGLIDCDIIERKMATITTKLFTIESMVYYIAGMFDGLEDGFDAHMEATILKIVTNEYAYEILQQLQQIAGSEMFIISKSQDQVNIFDSFLDGNIHNRLYLATMGVIWFARSKNVHLNQLRLAPWYPGYFVKTMFKEKAEKGDWLTVDADIYGHLHPSLKEAASNLEYIVKRVKYATENLVHKHGKDVTAAQSALYRLAQLSIDTFMLTTLCARASKSYCNGSRNSEIDTIIATNTSWELARKVKLYIEEIQASPLTLVDNRAKVINELNLKHGGYYAESPLDPNI